jgi:hypothetical protein
MLMPLLDTVHDNDNKDKNNMKDNNKRNSKSCSHLKYLYISICSLLRSSLARFTKGVIFLFLCPAATTNPPELPLPHNDAFIIQSVAMPVVSIIVVASPNGSSNDNGAGTSSAAVPSPGGWARSPPCLRCAFAAVALAFATQSNGCHCPTMMTAIIDEDSLGTCHHPPPQDCHLCH